MLGLWKQLISRLGRVVPPGQAPIDRILGLDNEVQMIITLSERMTAKIQQRGYDSLTEAEKTFNAVYWLEAEINNGGFDQYFLNNAGDYAQETVTALQRIGAQHTSQILLAAMRLFPGGAPSQDHYKRQEQLLSLGAQDQAAMQGLDQEFYAYTDPIGPLLIEYVRQHKDQF
jgi:uncharacterized protein with NAD-binding domain and iron-sulfur cluster